MLFSYVCVTHFLTILFSVLQLSTEIVFKTASSNVINCHANISCLRDFSLTGLLHVGDEVLEVEGRSVTGKTPDEVVQMLVRQDKFGIIFSIDNNHLLVHS